MTSLETIKSNLPSAIFESCILESAFCIKQFEIKPIQFEIDGIPSTYGVWSSKKKIKDDIYLNLIYSVVNQEKYLLVDLAKNYFGIKQSVGSSSILMYIESNWIPLDLKPRLDLLSSIIEIGNIPTLLEVCSDPNRNLFLDFIEKIQ